MPASPALTKTFRIFNSVRRARRAFSLALLALIIALPQAVAANKVPPPKVGLNQDFIEGLESKVDVDKPDTVFALIFRNLPDTVTV